MQFHHHGYVSGDPRVQPVAGTGIARPEALLNEIDILIVGGGPAGMITAAQLSQFPALTTRLIERRPERLGVGQADGIQPRSIETFQAFRFADRIVNEGCPVNEASFWNPDPADPSSIIRTSHTPNDPTGVSEFPHILVNQARVHDYFVEFMHNAPTRMTPDYGWELIGLDISRERAYPVTVTLRGTSEHRQDEQRTVHAKYVVGCDGAHSAVRQSIGRSMVGEQAAHAWGVMDILANTDFPDVRKKCVIQSKASGSILHIPREGGFLFRMYVDLGKVPEGSRRSEIRKTTVEDTIARAQEILHPYTLEVKHVARYTVYEVGHRLTDRFDDVAKEHVGSQTPRVFIAGDACHTHSAQAGQGMNVSLQDGFNLGWKLGHVASGLSEESLLDTYSAERQVIAGELIEFDRKWAALMATRSDDFEDPQEREDFFIKTAEFPAGFMTDYAPSMITAQATYQARASGFPLGKRFRSAPVVRVADANPMHLGHHASADGRWRIYAFADAFAGTTKNEKSLLATWAEWLASSSLSPVVAHTPEGADLDSIFDVKVIYQQKHNDVDLRNVPRIFLPEVGPFAVTDYEKIYASVPDQDIFAARGIDRRTGAVVVVRPDQYVAHVLPLATTDELTAFFKPILRAPKQPTRVAR